VNDSDPNDSPSGLASQTQRKLEQCVLGCALHDFKYVVGKGFGEVKKDWFTIGFHRAVYSSIMEVAADGDEVDLVNVGMKHPNHALEMATLFDAVSGAGQFPRYLRLLNEEWSKRSLLAAWGRCQEPLRGEAGYPGARAVLEDAFRHIDQGGVDDLSFTLRQVMDETLPQIAPKAERSTPGAIPTGIERLDEILGDGFARGSYNILAARPSMGKTAFATQIMYSASIRWDHCLFLSLEMSRTEIGKNLISLHSGINSWAIRRGSYPEETYSEVLAAAGELGDLPLEIIDEGNLSVDQIASAIRRKLYTGPLDLVVVDYLQLVKHGNGQSRDERVSEISKGLKHLAKETGVPLLVLAQLNREVDNPKRKDHRPKLSDLRESGAIEQDADVVMFLYRHGYYDKEQKAEEKDTGHSKTEVIVAKQRTGPVGTVYCDFNLRCGEFGPWSGEGPKVTSPRMTGNLAAQAYADAEDDDMEDPFQ
jgi:replicative DNA helicase